jgi:hypothetical protein
VRRVENESTVRPVAVESESVVDREAVLAGLERDLFGTSYQKVVHEPRRDGNRRAPSMMLRWGGDVVDAGGRAVAVAASDPPVAGVVSGDDPYGSGNVVAAVVVEEPCQTRLCVSPRTVARTSTCSSSLSTSRTWRAVTVPTGVARDMAGVSGSSEVPPAATAAARRSASPVGIQTTWGWLMPSKKERDRARKVVAGTADVVQNAALT